MNQFEADEAALFPRCLQHSQQVNTSTAHVPPATRRKRHKNYRRLAHIALVEVAPRLNSRPSTDDAVLYEAAVRAKGAQERKRVGGRRTGGVKKAGVVGIATAVTHPPRASRRIFRLLACLVGDERNQTHKWQRLHGTACYSTLLHSAHLSPMVTPSMTMQLLIFAFSPTLQ